MVTSDLLAVACLSMTYDLCPEAKSNFSAASLNFFVESPLEGGTSGGVVRRESGFFSCANVLPSIWNFLNEERDSP